MDDSIARHYAAGDERDRVRGGSSRIEFARTKELLERFLPPPAQVLDVGGGPGVYAVWLAERGYKVHLVDPVPIHVEQAAAAAERLSNPFTAAVGDARDLDAPDSSYDTVLLLGPLYHLTERDQRVAVLSRARQVVRPGGIVAATAISRFASLIDGLRSGWLGDPIFRAIVDRDLAEGQHRNPTDRPEWFTTAYFHHPAELSNEAEEADLAPDGLFGIEGPGWLLPDLWDDPRNRLAILDVARAAEEEPTLLGVSAHLLLIAHRAE